MNRCLVPTLGLIAFVALFVISVPTVEAVDKCKVKIDKKTGIVRVDATGVVGTLLWGPDAGQEVNAFFNAGACVTGDKAKKCEIADPATAASTIPPAGCTLYFVDDGATDCSTWIRSCTPGLRGGGTLETDVATLQINTQCMTATATDTIFEGCNVHVRNDSTTTNGTTDGLGNLIIGWNENTVAATRTGSHNLVVGPNHEFTSFGGQVVGRLSTISARYASVSGGERHTASGNASSVSGGFYNTASGHYGSVSGGSANQASGDYSSVSGGKLNNASYDFTSVGGGGRNTASGYLSSVSGGYYGLADGSNSAVSGGQYNTASGGYSSVSGGNAHTVVGAHDWQGGSYFSTD